MKKRTIGILHPGAMGTSIAAAAAQNGHDVYWASQGRSPQSQERAKKCELLDAQSARQLCPTCSVVICVCPPHAAADVAREVAGRNITVNTVAPGFVETEIIESTRQEAIDTIIANTPLGRMAKPEEVAYAVAFLASDQAAYITGQVLSIDGGLTMM